jgi:hypothetical protein
MAPSLRSPLIISRLLSLYSLTFRPKNSTMAMVLGIFAPFPPRKRWRREDLSFVFVSLYSHGADPALMCLHPLENAAI